MSLSPVTAAGTAAMVPTARARSAATASDSSPLNAKPLSSSSAVVQAPTGTSVSAGCSGAPSQTPSRKLRSGGALTARLISGCSRVASGSAQRCEAAKRLANVNGIWMLLRQTMESGFPEARDPSGLWSRSRSSVAPVWLLDRSVVGAHAAPAHEPSASDSECSSPWVRYQWPGHRAARNRLALRGCRPSTTVPPATRSPASAAVVAHGNPMIPSPRQLKNR